MPRWKKIRRWAWRVETKQWRMRPALQSARECTAWPLAVGRAWRTRPPASAGISQTSPGSQQCSHYKVTDIEKGCIPEEKAKVVAAVGGTEFIQFLAALAILHQEGFEQQEEFILFLHIILVQVILFFISSWCKSSFSSYHPGAIKSFSSYHPVHNSLRGKELNNFCPLNSSDDLCLLFCINPSSVVTEEIFNFCTAYIDKIFM